MSPIRLQDFSTNANAEGYMCQYVKMQQNVNLSEPGILINCILTRKDGESVQRIEVYSFQPSVSQYKQYANVVY